MKLREVSNLTKPTQKEVETGSEFRFEPVFCPQHYSTFHLW